MFQSRSVFYNYTNERKVNGFSLSFNFVISFLNFLQWYTEILQSTNTCSQRDKQYFGAPNWENVFWLMSVVFLVFHWITYWIWSNYQTVIYSHLSVFPTSGTTERMQVKFRIGRLYQRFFDCLDFDRDLLFSKRSMFVQIHFLWFVLGSTDKINSR